MAFDLDNLSIQPCKFGHSKSTIADGIGVIIKEKTEIDLPHQSKLAKSESSTFQKIYNPYDQFRHR